MLLCLAIIGTTQTHLPSEPALTLPVARGSCGFAGITDLPPVQASPFSPQCVQALLIIGGVEQNPGPAQLSTEQQLNDLDGILAGLSSNAPSNDVRDTMRLYDPRLDQKALERQINKASKTALVSCSKYLGRSDMNDFTKEACVTAMICRIQNLLPDQCHLCKEQYCINITDTPLISCALCGQGTHDQCISTFLHLTELERQSFTTADAWSRINPTKLPGLHYLCMECTDNTIPSEEAGKLKRKTKSTMMDDAEAATTQLQDRGVLQLLDVDEQENLLESSPRTSDIQPSPDQDNHEPISLNGDNDVSRTQNGDRDRAPLPDTRANICSFYRKGTCRYGISGRGCSKAHPKPCRKLLQHGIKAPHGCTLGRNCDKFHPRLCASSLRKGVCLKQSCRQWHIAGTNRTPPETDRTLHQDGNVNPQTTETSGFFRCASPSQGRNTGGNGSKTGAHVIRPASSGTTEYVSSKCLRSSRQHSNSSDDHCSSALDAHSASSNTQRSCRDSSRTTNPASIWTGQRCSTIHASHVQGSRDDQQPQRAQQPIYAAMGPRTHH